MTRTETAWLVILLAGAGTYAIRASFLAVAEKTANLSEGVREALRMIPAAALAALVTPALFRPEGSIDLWSPEAVAGVAAAVVAWRTENVLATIGTGLAGVVALRALGLG